MYTLKLVKGRSYFGMGVSAKIKNPLVKVASEEKANSLVKTGYFVLVSETVSMPDEEKSDEKPSKK